MSKKVHVEVESNGKTIMSSVKVVHIDGKNRKQFIDFQDRNTLSEDERLNIYPAMPKWVK